MMHVLTCEGARAQRPHNVYTIALEEGFPALTQCQKFPVHGLF